jgi:hypothetical protein
MPSDDEIHDQLQLLQSHRKTLSHYLNQHALLGAAFIPPAVTHGIGEARANIRRIKSLLRGWGVTCEDAPDDEAGEYLAPPKAAQGPARGISHSLLMEIRRELPRCDEFQSHARLRSVFGAEELEPWRAGFPEADSLMERVDLTIEYLRDKRRTDGRSALVLFLGQLAIYYDENDVRHARLVEIAARVAQAIAT